MNIVKTEKSELENQNSEINLNVVLHSTRVLAMSQRVSNTLSHDQAR
jgi:Flp pilus assembly protein CpaB